MKTPWCRPSNCQLQVGNRSKYISDSRVYRFSLGQIVQLFKTNQNQNHAMMWTGFYDHWAMVKNVQIIRVRTLAFFWWLSRSCNQTSSFYSRPRTVVRWVSSSYDSVVPKNASDHRCSFQVRRHLASSSFAELQRLLIQIRQYLAVNDFDSSETWRNVV